MAFTSLLKSCAEITRPIYQRIAGPDAALAEFPMALLRGIRGNYATLKVDDFVLKVDLRDIIVAGEMLFLKQYEPAETALLKSIIKHGDTAVDVGANIGYFSVLMARSVGPGGSVVAIEPDPDNRSLLEENISLNDIARLVSIVPAAVSDAPGRGTLYRSSQNHGDHRMWRTTNDERRREKRSPITVEVKTLDEILSSHGRIDCMKIDIQGFEAKAFGGLTGKFSEHDVAAILFEFWPYALSAIGFDPRDVISSIWKQGFKTWEVLSKGLEPILSLDFIDNFKGVEDASIFAANTLIADRQLSTLFSK